MELRTWFRGAAERAAAEHKRALWLAWHVAAFSRTATLKSLDSYMHPENRASRTIANLRTLAAQLPKVTH